MSCCDTGAELAMLAATDPREILLASRPIAGNLRQTDLSVPDVHCGACIHTVETALSALPGVTSARLNLSTKRVTIKWRADLATPPDVIEALRRVGYEAHLFEVDADAGDATLSELIRALAVSGFAAGNIMLFSVSVWSGAEPATRDLFHGLSALIALPTLIYAGRPFFRSAWQALRHGRTNMDVPISLGVSLAFGMSLYETAIHGPHAYFDASVSLLFFLLIGRTLDHMMRERARVAVKGLARLAARGALVQQEGGTQTYLPVAEIKPGMTILLAAGERVPVDSVVIQGLSELDVSLVSGESVPQPALAGTELRAGTLNLTGPLTITATAAANDSFLAEMLRMMEAAEQGRSTYRRIADRASSLYAPVVHLTALLTLIGWMFVEGDWHHAITIAVAVLIITCPCALGLAVPMVQVVAARKLFEHGVMIKDGGALERLAEIDTIVFDKTGTLTEGNPRLVNADKTEPALLTLAGTIAAHSRHPFSRALARVAPAAQPPLVFDVISEHPGCGMEARMGDSVLRLGRPEWALDCVAGHDIDTSSVVLSRDGRRLADFRFEDSLRTGAAASVAELKRDGFAIEVVSGDREAPVRALANALNVASHAGVLPGGKAEHIADLTKAGRKVLMVGDGLNDTPALMAAHASMAPASAADVGRNAADLVFLRDNLDAVPLAIAVAREAQTLVRQNLALAVGYNFIAVPIAILGYVTPLVAAIAMSGSSIVVVANALRLRGRRSSDAASPSKPAAMQMEPAE